MRIFDRFFKKAELISLQKLVETNPNGENRTEILRALKTEKLIIGANQKFTNTIIDSSTKLDYLTSTTPDKKGHALLAFIDESLLQARNPNAYPLAFDIKAIRMLLDSGALDGLVLISKSAWVYFPKEDLTEE